MNRSHSRNLLELFLSLKLMIEFSSSRTSESLCVLHSCYQEFSPRVKCKLPVWILFLLTLPWRSACPEDADGGLSFCLWPYLMCEFALYLQEYLCIALYLPGIFASDPSDISLISALFCILSPSFTSEALTRRHGFSRPSE